MPGSHRNGDARICGAKTVVVNQNTVFVNSRLWAVRDDPNTHGNGNLINTVGYTVFIHEHPVIVLGDDAKPDNAGHSNPKPAEASSNVFAYS